MVIRHKKMRGARGIAVASCAGWLLAIWLLLPLSAGANQTFQFITLKSGTMTAEDSGDKLFDVKEAENGALQQTREVNIQGVEWEFFATPNDRFGLGLALETHQYAKNFRFVDESGALTSDRISINGRSLLYTLRFYFRLGPFIPFIGAGSGNYYVKYSERLSSISFIDSAPDVWTTRYGFRMLLGRFGLLVEQGQIRAPLKIRSRSDQPTLELGGNYTAFGLSWSY